MRLAMTTLRKAVSSSLMMRPWCWLGSMRIRANEDIFERNRLGDHVALVEISDERLQRLSVRLDTVGPPIAAEHLVDLVDVRRHPWQHVAQRTSLGDSIPDQLARFGERLVKTGRCERMPLIDVAAHRDEMHDREYPRALVVILLDLAIVRKE